MFYPLYYADSLTLSIFIKDVELSNTKIKLLSPSKKLMFYAERNDALIGCTAIGCTAISCPWLARNDEANCTSCSSYRPNRCDCNAEENCEWEGDGFDRWTCYKVSKLDVVRLRLHDFMHYILHVGRKQKQKTKQCMKMRFHRTLLS